MADSPIETFEHSLEGGVKFGFIVPTARKQRRWWVHVDMSNPQAQNSLGTNFDFLEALVLDCLVHVEGVEGVSSPADFVEHAELPLFYEVSGAIMDQVFLTGDEQKKSDGSCDSTQAKIPPSSGTVATASPGASAQKGTATGMKTIGSSMSTN